MKELLHGRHLSQRCDSGCNRELRLEAGGGIRKITDHQEMNILRHIRTCRSRSRFGKSKKLDLRYETTTDTLKAQANINFFFESRFITVMSIACLLQGLNFHVKSNC